MFNQDSIRPQATSQFGILVHNHITTDGGPYSPSAHAWEVPGIEV